jgi:hypothetical protein
MAEKIDIGKLLHLFDINSLNDLLIVEENPGVAVLPANILANEGHIVSAKCVSHYSFKQLGQLTQHELNLLCDRPSNVIGNEQGESLFRKGLSPSAYP